MESHDPAKPASSADSSEEKPREAPPDSTENSAAGSHVDARVVIEEGQLRGILGALAPAPQPKPRNWEGAWTAALVFATVGLIYVTWSGTDKTLQLETEEKLLPIVMLASQDDTVAHQNTIVIRNIGFGPALNTATRAITLDRARVFQRANPLLDHKTGKASLCVDVREQLQWETRPSAGEVILRLNHRRAIAPTETHDIDATEEVSGQPLLHAYKEMCLESPFKRVTPISNIESLIGEKAQKLICISYENAAGDSYETWQRMASQSPGNLALDYICQRTTPRACSAERVAEAQKRLASVVDENMLESVCPAK